MKKFKFLFIFLLILSTGCQSTEMNNQSKIIINNVELDVEIVKTPREIAQGLSGRGSLCEDCGMLFEFSDYQIRNFWMKDMNFSLDIIWIKDEAIVGIAENVPVIELNGQISRVQSSKAVNKVLEVNAGWAKDHNVKTGDKVFGLD